MEDQTCRACGRPLQMEDDQYCPSCRAKQADRFGKFAKAASAAVTVTVTIVGLIMGIIIKRRP